MQISTRLNSREEQIAKCKIINLTEFVTGHRGDTTLSYPMANGEVVYRMQLDVMGT